MQSASAQTGDHSQQSFFLLYIGSTAVACCERGQPAAQVVCVCLFGGAMTLREAVP